MSKWSGLGALSAGAGVALSWLCCLPFAAALGAGVAALGTALSPYQPFMVVTSLALLGIAFVQTARTPRCKEGEACTVSSRRRWLFLAVISLATILLITLPYWSAHLIYWAL